MTLATRFADLTYRGSGHAHVSVFTLNATAQHNDESMTLHGTRRLPVTVVIPCYRSQGTIERAVRSVVNQTALPAEVIMVEDGSEDDGLTLRALERVRLFYRDRLPMRIVLHKRNLGLACARNTGWNIADQPYIAFLDADDSWHPCRLDIQYAWLSKDANAAVIGTPHVWLRPHQALPAWPSQYDIRRVAFRDLVHSNPFNASSILIRRDVPVRFQSGKRYCEDYLLWLTLARSGYALYLLTLPLAYAHKPPYGYSGLSADLWAMEVNELANYITLLRGSMLSRRAWTLATVWSVAKFLRRLIVCTIQMRTI